MSSQITKENLLNFTHQLHCKLRGAKGIKLTGLPALNEIENILFFRFMEERKEIRDIPNEIKFTKICEKYATDEKIQEDNKIPTLSERNCYKLWVDFYDGTNQDCILIKYFGNQQVKKYIKSNVTRVSAFIEKPEACQTIQILFNMVYNKFKNITFDSNFYDMFGSAHEEFKTNEHGNSGKHTGQHFTPMDIKKLVVEELNIKSTEIYYEPCAGTGGFIHTVDKYVRENEGEKASKKFKNNIYANECNPEMIKPLMINMLLHNIPVEKIQEADSLGYNNILETQNKMDVIGTNYPFGMSNDINLNDYGSDGKKYWNCLIRGNKVIKNSTGQFILHIYNSLNSTGRAGFVSDRGILNNGDEKSWEADIRKFIITNTNVYKSWLLPSGVFPYTSFATCVIFFKKGEETKEVKFYEGKFKDMKNKKELYIEKEPLKIFTIDELIVNKYSFKLEEKKEEIKKGWVKLGEVINLLKKSKHKASEGLDEGLYNFYTSSNKIKKSNINEFNDNCIIIGSGGNGSLFIDKNFCCSADNFIITSKKNIMIEYLYYYLKINFSKFYELFKGNGLKHLSQNDLLNFEIPLLSIKHQEYIVKLLNKEFELYDINQLSKVTNTIPIFDLLINQQYDLFLDALYLIYRKKEIEILQTIYKKINTETLKTQIEKDNKVIMNINKEFKFTNQLTYIEYGEMLQTQIELITTLIKNQEFLKNDNELIINKNEEQFELTEDLIENCIDNWNDYELKNGEILLSVNIKKINDLWKKDENNYISKKYENIENKEKYLKIKKDLIELKILEPPKIYYDKKKELIIFERGRNCFSIFRDFGCEEIIIITNKNTKKKLKKL